MGVDLSLGLHVCRVCASKLVRPVIAVPLESGLWFVELVCPNCWSGRRSVHDEADLDRLEDELDRGDAALRASLKELTDANHREEIERFARALAADAILPMDF